MTHADSNNNDPGHDRLAGLPGLAVVANSPAPYRVALHQALADGIPEFRFVSVFTHGAADFDWALNLPESIGPVVLAEQGESPAALGWKHPRKERARAHRLLHELNQRNVKAVVMHGYNYPHYLLMLRRLQQAGVPVFLRGDSNALAEVDVSPAKAFLKHRVMSFVRKRIHGVLPVGSAGEDYFKAYGFDPQRMWRVPFTPDYHRWAHPDPRKVQELSERFDLGHGRNRILFMGRLTQVKRVDVLIDAFARIAQERPDWELVIAGKGELEDDLKRRVPDELRARVRFVGFLNVDELSALCGHAGLMCLPSDYEPWALVVNEALSAGLGVITSDVVGAAADLVEPGVNGDRFPRGDVSALADRLRHWTAPGMADKASQGSREVLDRWRSTWDPVNGLRAALADAGVLSG
ncbi:MAG: glycosyltransferase family 4 protein [Planctomycetota bacterium]